tara:strand:+ start:4478 stop:5995 length:1518 start_codon:yes stop_codon:yes gene_type:complete
MITDSELEKRIIKIQNKLQIELFDEVIFDSKVLLKKRKHQILYNIISLAYQGKGEYINSVKIMEEGLKIDSQNIFFLNNLAISQHKLGNFNEAEENFKKAMKIDPNYINVLNNFANLKKDLDQTDDAIKLYNKSIKIKSDILITNYNLASIYLGIGDYENALKYFKIILELNSKFTLADRAISLITKYSKDNHHFLEMKKKYDQNNLNSNQKIELNFALGKAYEDLKDYKNSFFHISNANNLKKKIINYDINQDIELFKNIKSNFSEYLNNSIKKNDKKIIFIVGMPRSGTTLVEQIISSHSKVYGAGELVFLTELLMNNVVENKKISDFQSIQDEYLKKVFLIDKSDKIITDKAPLNFRWIGYIKLIFPNSKVVHCKRDIMDNCWSIYKNNFDAGLNFSFNLKDLGSFYTLYKDLMKFWKSTYSNDIHDINYEDLIDNQELETKKLLKFCGLDWDPNCLKHYNNKKIIKTVSAVQARKPIYKTSIKSSQNYIAYLDDLKNNLKA